MLSLPNWRLPKIIQKWCTRDKDCTGILSLLIRNGLMLKYLYSLLNLCAG